MAKTVKKKTEYQSFMKTAKKEVMFKDVLELQKKMLNQLSSHSLFWGTVLNPKVSKMLNPELREALKMSYAEMDKQQKELYSQFYKTIRFPKKFISSNSFNSYKKEVLENFKKDVREA